MLRFLRLFFWNVLHEVSTKTKKIVFCFLVLRFLGCFFFPYIPGIVCVAWIDCSFTPCSCFLWMVRVFHVIVQRHPPLWPLLRTAWLKPVCVQNAGIQAPRKANSIIQVRWKNARFVRFSSKMRESVQKSGFFDFRFVCVRFIKCNKCYEGILIIWIKVHPRPACWRADAGGCLIIWVQFHIATWSKAGSAALNGNDLCWVEGTRRDKRSWL